MYGHLPRSSEHLQLDGYKPRFLVHQPISCAAIACPVTTLPEKRREQVEKQEKQVQGWGRLKGRGRFLNLGGGGWRQQRRRGGGGAAGRGGAGRGQLGGGACAGAPGCRTSPPQSWAAEQGSASRTQSLWAGNLRVRHCMGLGTGHGHVRRSCVSETCLTALNLCPAVGCEWGKQRRHPDPRFGRFSPGGEVVFRCVLCPSGSNGTRYRAHLEGLPRLRRLIFFHLLRVIQTFLSSATPRSLRGKPPVRADSR